MYIIYIEKEIDRFIHSCVLQVSTLLDLSGVSEREKGDVADVDPDMLLPLKTFSVPEYRGNKQQQTKCHTTLHIQSAPIPLCVFPSCIDEKFIKKVMSSPIVLSYPSHLTPVWEKYPGGTSNSVVPSGTDHPHMNTCILYIGYSSIFVCIVSREVFLAHAPTEEENEEGEDGNENLSSTGDELSRYMLG